MKTRTRIAATLALALSALLATSAQAGSATLTKGEVRKVDLKAQTITLKHEAIKNLDMPGMTMAFKVKTPELMAKLKPGDLVTFTAEMPNGALTITTLELLR